MVQIVQMKEFSCCFQVCAGVGVGVEAGGAVDIYRGGRCCGCTAFITGDRDSGDATLLLDVDIPGYILFDCSAPKLNDGGLK